MKNLISVATGLWLALTVAASAQSFPNRPIRLIIPYSPGGIVDFAGRVLGNKLGEQLHQTVVPENRPGAGGISGTDVAARAAPDGYTLLIMDPAIVINPTLQPSVPYDLFKQLSALSIVSSSPEVLVVAPGMQIQNVADLLDYARKNPTALNFASAGIGTTPHLAGELLKLKAKIEATHVPYRSIGESYPDLISNKVQFAFSSIAGALPFTTSKQVRPIATTGSKRTEVYPDIPTVMEAGVADFEIDLWLGVFAPAGLPKDVAQRLNEALSVALKDEELRKAFAKTGIEARGTSIEDSSRIISSEFQKWKNVISSAGIKEK
jgi:tripartite-type tricarboxylate transporter receptor subunit TctC